MPRPIFPLLLLVLVAGAGCRSPAAAAGGGGAAPLPPPTPGTTAAPRTAPAPAAPVAGAPAAPDPRPRPDVPATHLGRTVLREADAVVVGTVSRVSPPFQGGEIARVEVDETLRGPAASGPVTVLCARAGVLPRSGARALFLLRSLASGNADLVQVAELEGAAGEARLAALRRYLEIESLPSAQERVERLREYLREALADGDSWTRANAVREYAALADAFPDSLGLEDAEALRSARPRVREREIVRLLDAALAAAGGAPAPPTVRIEPEADLGPFEARFSAPEASYEERRSAVVEAAVRHGERAGPLLERALADPDERVREAGAAAAGELRVAALEPRLAELLLAESSTPLLRTLVLALGHLRSERAVPRLSELAAEGGPVSREACFALARVRNAAALARLGELRRDARGRERAELVDFLLSDAFLAQERALGAR